MPFTDSEGNTYRDSTPEENAARRTLAVNATHYASWVWNEDAVSYLPLSNPPDKTSHMWDEDTTTWVPYSG